MPGIEYTSLPTSDIEAAENAEALKKDPEWTGIKRERTCQDITFALLYLAVVGGMIACGTFAFTRGNPSILESINPEHIGWFTESLVQLHENRAVLACSIGLSVVVALVWVQLLKVFTRLFVLLTLLLGVFVVVAAGVVLVVYGSRAESLFMEIIGGFAFVIALCIVIGAIVLRRQISVSITLMKEACRGLQNNLSLLGIAVLLVAVLAGLIVLWVMSLAYLFTVPDGETGLQHGVRYLTLLMVLGLLWTFSLLSSVFRATVAGSVASWYFSRNPYARQESGNPTLNALGRALTKSLGSLALGSLIVSFLEFMNLIASAADRQTKNRVLHCIIRAIRCVLSVFVSLARSFNRFAFVYVAMYGESFCVSGKRVKGLVARSPLSSIVSDQLVNFVLIVGQLLGMAVSCLLTVFVFTYFQLDVTPVPLVAAGLSALAIFGIVSLLLLTAVNTVFVCYLEDLERNGDTGSFYATQELHEHLQSMKP